MTELKPSWQRVRFGDVVRLNKETCKDPAAEGIERAIGLEHLEPGDLRVRSWANVADGTTFTNRVRPGQVLFGKRRAYQRKVAVADFDAVCSGDIYVFESADPNKLHPELLPFICQTDSFLNHAVGTSAGSLSPRTNWSSISQHELELPPLEEQQKTALALKANEHARQCADRATDSFRDVRLRAYIDWTTRGFKARHESQMHATPLGLIPTNWKCEELGKVANVMNHHRKPINASLRSQMQGPYPYFGPTGILDNISEFRLEGEYVLLGEDGDHFLKWRTWSMTQITQGRFNVNNHAHVMEGTNGCRTRWIYHYFRHRSIKEWLTKQGAGRLKLKKESLLKIWIALPPLEEQTEIIARLEAMDGALASLQERSASPHNIAPCLEIFKRNS